MLGEARQWSSGKQAGQLQQHSDTPLSCKKAGTESSRRSPENPRTEQFSVRAITLSASLVLSSIRHFSRLCSFAFLLHRKTFPMNVVPEDVTPESQLFCHAISRRRHHLSLCAHQVSALHNSSCDISTDHKACNERQLSNIWEAP